MCVKKKYIVKTHKHKLVWQRADIRKIISQFFSMSAEIDNLVCDAVPDPPRFTKESLKEQIHRSQEQKSEKTPPNPEVNGGSDKLNNRPSNQENGNASDDRDSNHEKDQERKPNSKRKSRKTGRGGTVINNVVKDSSYVYFNFSTQNLINMQMNSGSTSKKERRGSEEKCIKKMPPHIESLAECQSTIIVADKLTVKKNIGANWKIVAKKLGLKKSEVEQKVIDHNQDGVGEVMFQVLTVWEQKQGHQATLGSLIKALWASEEYDCTEELAIIHGSAHKPE